MLPEHGFCRFLHVCSSTSHRLLHGVHAVRSWLAADGSVLASSSSVRMLPGGGTRIPDAYPVSEFSRTGDNVDAPPPWNSRRNTVETGTEFAACTQDRRQRSTLEARFRGENACYTGVRILGVWYWIPVATAYPVSVPTPSPGTWFSKTAFSTSFYSAYRRIFRTN